MSVVARKRIDEGLSFRTAAAISVFNPIDSAAPV